MKAVALKQSSEFISERRKSSEREVKDYNAKLGRSNNQLSPPLPLMKFKFPSSKPIEVVKTINGEVLRNIDNKFPSQLVTQARDKIFDPVYSRKLIKYFTARSHKENNIKQLQEMGASLSMDESVEKFDLFEYCVYESYLHSESLKERSLRNADRKPEDIIHQERIDSIGGPSRTTSLNTINDSLSAGGSSGTSSKPPTPVSSRMSPSTTKPSYTKSLNFDGEFECGNIERINRVFGRESLINTTRGENNHDFVMPLDVDQEYDITVRKDVNTEGNIQWFYFSATAGEDLFSTVTNGSAVTYPLRVRFNLINMQKKDSLYNYGMKPAVYSVNQIHNEDWVHCGDDICYYRNGLTYIKASNSDSNSSRRKPTVMYHSTLTFTYVFKSPDTVYFAHTYPYSYTDLQYYLNYLESDTRTAPMVHRRPLCKTLAGNNCDILSITERSTGVVEGRMKPSIVVSARVHPGEANSSFMIHGLIEFLTGESPEALKLRRSFIFHIVPMMNPDGVVHGNYRCSLAGTDLNRRFLDTHKALHPTVSALKAFIKSTQQHRQVLMYLDLHGHSKMKNCFLYGCDIVQQPEKVTKAILPLLTSDDIAARRVYARVFPKILCTVSKSLGHNNFSYGDCNFRMDRSKMGTGRIVCWKELGIPASYTIEVSFCGNGDNRESKLLKKAEGGIKTDVSVGTQFTPKSSLKQSKSNGSSLEDSIASLGDIYPSWRSAMNSESDPLSELLTSYQTATHYTKQDLLTLGYELGIAIFHFANLTHSNLENEIQLALLNDQKLRKQQSILRSTSDHHLPVTTERPKDQELSKISSAEPCYLVSGSNLRSPDRKKRLESALRDVDVSETHLEELSADLATPEFLVGCAIGSGSEDESRVVIQNKRDDIGSVGTEDDGSNDGHVSDRTAAGAVETTLTPRSALLDKYASSRVEYVEESAITRSMMRPIVYSKEALLSLIRQFNSEFYLPDCATLNVGLRVKCEYSIRRWLELEGIEMHDEHCGGHLTSSSLGFRDGENRSNDGSDSDPSADNVPTSKLLRNMSKFKDTNALVAALRKEVIRRKKKETEERNKTEKKRLKHIAKKEKEAKKALEDAQVELLLLAKKKAEAEAMALAQEEARLRAMMDRRPSSSVRRKNSIFQSIPKYVPNYRYAPEEKPAAAPVQIRQINFKDFDGTGGSSSGSAYGISTSTLCNLYNNVNANPLMGVPTRTAVAAIVSTPNHLNAYNSMGHTSSYIGEDGVLTTVMRPKTCSGYPDSHGKRINTATCGFPSSPGFSMLSSDQSGNLTASVSHNSALGASATRQLGVPSSATVVSTSGGIAFTTPSARIDSVHLKTSTTSSYNVLYNCERPSAASTTGSKSEKADKSSTGFSKSFNGLTLSHYETTNFPSSEALGIASDTSAEAALLTNRSKSILYSLPNLDSEMDGVKNGMHFVLPSSRRGSFSRPKSAAGNNSKC